MVLCEKVVVTGEQVNRLGSDIPVDWANGEFIGFERFSPQALKLLNRLVWMGLRVYAIAIFLNTSNTFANLAYQLPVLMSPVIGQNSINRATSPTLSIGTKAETLSRLGAWFAMQ